MKRDTRLFVGGQAYIPVHKLSMSPSGNEVCGEPIQRFALYEASELEPAQVLLMKLELARYRLLGTPESIADRLKAAGSAISRIERFEDGFEFLSNFHACTVTWEGFSYKSVESAFQAAKCANLDERAKFLDCTPSEAKKLGRRCKLRPDWESVKDNIMETLVWQKFQNNSNLRTLLLETDDAELVEGNWWHDNFWGDCKCTKCASIQGENRLGVILMNVRSKLRREQEQTLSLELPDGSIFRARPSSDPLYPGISISVVHEANSAGERLCFAELNGDRNDRLFIGAYNAAEEDCVYYAPYHTAEDANSF